MHREELQITQDQTTESVILMRIFNSIVHKWWLFCIVGLVGGIIGFIYAKLQKPVYESYLSFALDEGGSEGGASGAMGLAAQFGISIGGSQDVFTGDNILEIMQSRRVIERALLSVDTFDNKPMTLIEYYLQNNPRKNKEVNIHFYPGEQRSSFSYLKDSILYNTYLEFKNYHITARRPDKRLNIYELLVTSRFEEFSKVFTDKLILETNSFYTEIRSKKSKETLEILEKRVPDMKEKLDATITSKAAIQDANLNTAFENARIPLLKQESNGQVYAAAYAEMFRNLELARFQYLKSIPLMQVIDNADYPMKKIKMSKLKTAIIFSVMAAFIFLVIFIIMNFFRFRAS
ncbi:hypothetical protein FW778_06330 [Ginsengibacter hankyongi]|uniref:Polysaccharide chain length determinant N-terminal domain-containing protein n=1 Tax=Ginsengibacter hankyongi TaxID=2607284 RepID=A0A5J5IKM1_9BACT|nr:Wzz/FepE/Etk N-terminal domain-containing protein [Ginsengibacter hankyongi]KAA9041635.1 hypothetical protein FW778_06330 [Ginsengibacter hankyongi]